uniref:Uncharacterized protein n=1 Tax=Solanum lycopersicum TaxID=4081 RepID=K4BZH2_SOLLC
MMRPSWPSSSNRGRGRGRGGRTNNNVLAQIGNQKLIAATITRTPASTSTGISGIEASNPIYQEFMDFIKSRQQEQPSYSAVANEEVVENIEVYDQNDLDETILILDQRDLQWKDEPWQIMTRKIQMKGGVISKYEILAFYMEEVKSDLMKHLGKSIPKNATDNMSVSTSNEDGLSSWRIPGRRRNGRRIIPATIQQSNGRIFQFKK